MKAKADIGVEQKKDAMDIVTESLLSLNLLKNLTVALFDQNLQNLTIEQFYDKWKMMVGPRGNASEYFIPYSFGAIIGTLYCGIMLAKENWYDLIPEQSIADADVTWGLSSASYKSPARPTPSIKYVIRRIRNALGHGNVKINLSAVNPNHRDDKDDFEKNTFLTFCDEDPKNSADIFEIKITFYDLSDTIKKFYSIVHNHLQAK
jgi:hypothetical protein